ncbi:hypothetical protein BJP34_28855 [Moorena producens PAL-8-15-08-1]|uniref:Uncharacterized protein n=1 Tax=Moorena producens PAL-8-15-08-1 TaxID=1458985 RepID=A0A1D8TZ39_9CYAN|nr:hypothetical protein [Moorena producens]AOX02917.1 hypothetical protein BJP34_28855 [Moorena producens PAL-8-15-08-1]
MAKNPYDFDLDGAVSLLIQLAGGAIFTVWGCYAPNLQILNAAAGVAGGAWAIGDNWHVKSQL